MWTFSEDSGQLVCFQSSRPDARIILFINQHKGLSFILAALDARLIFLVIYTEIVIVCIRTWIPKQLKELKIVLSRYVEAIDTIWLVNNC